MNVNQSLPIKPSKWLYAIEDSAQFMINNLFQGDLAVWEKELLDSYPELKLNRQPRDEPRPRDAANP